jgi:hypothetical protein
MANVVSDLLAPSVWHIGTFIVATSRYGAGDAQVLYRSLESWALRSGACWLRLGVVRGNARAERFWEREGFSQARLRTGVEMGKLTNTLRVMFKPLAGGSMVQYLALVNRDRPEDESAILVFSPAPARLTSLCSGRPSAAAELQRDRTEQTALVGSTSLPYTASHALHLRDAHIRGGGGQDLV